MVEFVSSSDMIDVVFLSFLATTSSREKRRRMARYLGLCRKRSAERVSRLVPPQDALDLPYNHKGYDGTKKPMTSS
jgi:hypothetical protein